MCGTIKDYVIEYNNNPHSLLDYSIYDTNPVYLFSSVNDNITWTTKKENTA